MMGFGMAAILLNLHNAGLFPNTSVILAMGLCMGGLAQIIAGWLEFKRGQTMAAVAFIGYGLFWFSLVANWVLSALNLAEAPSEKFMGCYLSLWAIFSLFLFLSALRAGPEREEPMIQDYLFPSTIDEALALLARHSGRAKIIGGGTDLLLEKDLAADYLVDLGRITELDGISESDGQILIRSNVTHAQCAAHPLIQQNAPLLAQASGTVGSTQIRNVATVAGNIVSANPAADAAVALTALKAVVIIRSQSGLVEVPITEVYAGVGCSTVDCGSEIIVGVKFPVRQPGEGNAYERLEQRQGLSLPMASAAVNIRIHNGLITQAVIVAAPLAPSPTRIPQAEKYLLNQKPTEEHFQQAGILASENVSFRSSPTRGGAEYRHQVLPVLVCRALQTAAERAIAERFQ